MEAATGALVFPPTPYVFDGESTTYRVRWTLMGDDAYEAWSEAQGPKGWSTMLRMKLSREP